MLKGPILGPESLDVNVVLRVVAGPHTGTEYCFDRHDTFVVGRSSQVQFPVPDDRFLSRDHFLVEFNPPQCFLKDMGSTNGTKLNGQKVDQALLRDGDVVEAGKSRFLIVVNDTSADMPGIKCRVCGALPPPDLSIAVVPGEQNIAWYCDACREHRKQYPRAPRASGSSRGSAGGAWARSTAPGTSSTTAPSPSRC